MRREIADATTDSHAVTPMNTDTPEPRPYLHSNVRARARSGKSRKYLKPQRLNKKREKKSGEKNLTHAA